MAGGIINHPDLYNKDSVDEKPRLRTDSIVTDANGTPIEVNDSGQLKVVLGGTVCTCNSTSTPLLADAVFEGEVSETLDYALIFVSIYSDKASATNGFKYYTSSDGVLWHLEDSFTIPAATSKTFSFQPNRKYFKTEYTNGSEDQTVMDLQVIFKKTNSKSSSHKIQDSISTEDDAELVKSVHTAKDEQGIYRNITSTTNGVTVQSINTTSIEKVNAPFIGYFRQVVAATGYTTTASSVAKDATVIPVVDGTKITVGHILNLYTATGAAFYSGEVLSKATNDITVDTPVNAAFDAGASVSSGLNDLSVNGSVTPQIFTIRQPNLPVLATGVEIVIHRIIFQCYTATEVNDFAEFADITGLTKGLFLRYQNGVASNIFNVKSNGDFSNLAYDFSVFDATKQNVNGFTCRLTFGGNSKMGTSILLKDGDALEMWVQDNLTGITGLRILGEGYLRAV